MEINRNKQTNIFIDWDRERRGGWKGGEETNQSPQPPSPPPPTTPNTELLAQVPAFYPHSETETVISVLT